MLSQIKGKLLEKSPTRVVVDVGGIGFEIHVPVSTFEKLPELGEQVLLLTHLHVREDILQLFGFWAEKDRRLFQLLISISGVGPRMGLGILSSVSVEEFSGAVANNNFSILTKIPGVGKKTAQRLVIELKDKLSGGIELPSEQVSIKDDIIEQAVLAMVSLGYRPAEAQKAVEKVASANKVLPSVEILIKKVLQNATSKG